MKIISGSQNASVMLTDSTIGETGLIEGCAICYGSLTKYCYSQRSLDLDKDLVVATQLFFE